METLVPGRNTRTDSGVGGRAAVAVQATTETTMEASGPPAAVVTRQAREGLGYSYGFRETARAHADTTHCRLADERGMSTRKKGRRELREGDAGSVL